ncbi:MAG: hypothetical protein H7343_14220 [Undibacterium sp.]|nr:hypothetical protein [Opitutaceae bacterium]
MKTSPKLVLTLLALGLGVTAPTARAANQPTVEVAPQVTPEKSHHPVAEKRVKKAVAAHDKTLTEKLKLTAEQQEKLAALRKEQGEELKAAQGDRGKLREAAVASRAQVRAILTPEQQKEFDAMPPEGRAGKKAKKGEQS